MVWLETSSVPERRGVRQDHAVFGCGRHVYSVEAVAKRDHSLATSVDAHVVEKLSVEFVALGYKDVRVLYRLDDRSQI